jgi:hypothetical protein
MKEPYNDTSNPNVIITEPAPGNFVILGHNPQTRFVEDEGYIVPSRMSEIPQEVPTSALMWILNQRGVNVGAQVEVVKGAATPVFEPAKESLNEPVGSTLMLPARVVELIKASESAIRLSAAAVTLGVPAGLISDAAGIDFEIASGGWLKLIEKGEAQ